MPHSVRFSCGFAVFCVSCLLSLPSSVFAGPTESQADLTPRQRAIEKQRQRLASAEVEERRDAIAQLGVMRHPDAARVALSALKDSAPIVRASAAKAILVLPADEAVVSLIPLLTDRDEFVREEAAFALGKTRSAAAVSALTEALIDKKDGVRAAAVIALGEIADQSAVGPLIQVLSGSPLRPLGKSKRKPRKEQNQFVLRAATVALGQIGSRTAVPELIKVLGREELASDVKRGAARSLGLIGDPSAVPALQTALGSADPYLSQAASAALKAIAEQNRNP